MMVFKMRLNLRKVFFIILASCILWCVWLYMSTIEVKKVPVLQKVEEFENSLNILEARIEGHLAENKRLLNKIKQHMKKTDSLAKDSDANKLEESLPSKTVLPVLVIACDRVTIQRCIEKLVGYRPNKETFPIIVSQDCGHEPTYKIIERFVKADDSISVVRHTNNAPIKLTRSNLKFQGYYKIARHFRFALNHVFKTLKHEAVIIVEDDLDISPDFFEYFLGTYPLLLKDPSLWCISAWNDNGKKNLIDLTRPELLHRTDFFPGLGWLLRKDSWEYLEPAWPPAFFDDWLRNPINTRNRSCIRPEISRTYTFGKIGVSRGLFYDNHLRHMQLNNQFVEFTKMNLSYLIKENYDKAIRDEAFGASPMTAAAVMSLPYGAGRPVKVAYHDAKTFQRAAKTLGLMDDFRSGIPRTAYLGIVSCFIRGRRVFLVPDFDWRYDPSWG